VVNLRLLVAQIGGMAVVFGIALFGAAGTVAWAAATGYVAGTALLLGSWLGLAAGSLIVLSAAVRAVQEERVLRAELPGYETYAARMRYRLLPGVW
jgi:protein-S-isoprenylcysteine O-methyltransferase Ste14